MVSQGLVKLEEEKSEVQRSRDAAADAAEMGEKHCIAISRLSVPLLAQEPQLSNIFTA